MKNINFRVYGQVLVIALIAIALGKYTEVPPMQYLVWVALTKLIFLEYAIENKESK